MCTRARARARVRLQKYLLLTSGKNDIIANYCYCHIIVYARVYRVTFITPLCAFERTVKYRVYA